MLLCALVTWGADALPRLNGMYAFAYWDGRGQRLMLGRDPLGIKPLLLSRTAGGLVFASELRALWKSGVVDPHVSPGAVRSFLTYGAVIEPETTLSSVVAVPPGRVITATPDGRIGVPADVWTLDQVLQVHHGPAAAKRRQPHSEPAIHRALEAAVRRHLVSDARLGVLLSGGIDSPLLAALADRAPGHTPEFITIGFQGLPSPDVEFSSAVASRLHGTHSVLMLSGRELAHQVPAAIAAMDQPTVDGINTFVVSSAASSAGVRVLLSGLGGDELFGGYTTFRRAPLLARFGGLAAPVAPVLSVLDSKAAEAVEQGRVRAAHHGVSRCLPPSARHPLGTRRIPRCRPSTARPTMSRCPRKRGSGWVPRRGGTTSTRSPIWNCRSTCETSCCGTPISSARPSPWRCACPIWTSKW